MQLLRGIMGARAPILAVGWRRSFSAQTFYDTSVETYAKKTTDKISLNRSKENVYSTACSDHLYSAALWSADDSREIN